MPRWVWGYGALRFVQVLLIAAGFLEPVVATMMLAWGSASAVYVLLAVVGLACVLLALARDTRPVRAF